MKSLLFIPLLFCALFASAQYAKLSFAKSVDVKSSESNNSSENILGAPDVFPAYWTSEKAWTIANDEDAKRFIELGFDQTIANRIYIYQTYKPGNITSVQFKKSPITAWFDADIVSDNPQVDASNILVVSMSVAQDIAGVRINLAREANGELTQIDAVAIANIEVEPTVSLSETSLWLHKNITPSDTLIPTVTNLNADSDTVYWTSSDEEVASVTPDGVVTAVAPGIATITATIGTGATATCTVKVDMGFGTNPLFDFEPTTNNFLGTGLFTFTDKSQSPAGNSTITPATIDLNDPGIFSTPGAFGTDRALTLNYSLDQSAYPYEPYAAVAFNTNADESAEDLSAYSGIGFWHMGDAFTLYAKLTTTKSKSNSYYGISVPNSVT